MNIFITGAAGYIGGSVAHVLLGAGHAIRGLVRSRGKLEKLASLGITPVLGDLDNPPHHLLLGNDAFEGATAKLEALGKEFNAWESVSRGADFPKVKLGLAA